VPAADAISADALLVLWGSSDVTSLDALLVAAAPLARRRVVLRLPGGDEAAKDGFFRDGILLEQLDSLPVDRAAARELLFRIEILPPPERQRR
jgi:hypothetical protein